MRYCPIRKIRYIANFGPFQSYDSRTVEQVIYPKVIDFINENAKQRDPFFIYYGMRSGHRPFNSPLKFRNKTEAGKFDIEILLIECALRTLLFDNLKSLNSLTNKNKSTKNNQLLLNNRIF